MGCVTFDNIDKTNAKEIVDIYNYYVLNTTASYNTDAISADDFLAYYQIDNPLTKSFAIKCCDDLAGFMVLKPWNYKKQAYRQTYEFTIYLKKEYCRKGIGKIAFAYLEAMIKDSDIAVIMAGLSADNEGSRALLESQGFTECGRFKKIGKKFGKYLDISYYQKSYEEKFTN